VDFAQLIRIYRALREGEARYSAAEVASVEVVPVSGRPDPERICTSIVERQNLTMRMQIRRLTRLTSASSKKGENLWAALCLHLAYYDLCRIHRTLRVTPQWKRGSRITCGIWGNCWRDQRVRARSRRPPLLSHSTFPNCCEHANIKDVLQNQLLGYILWTQAKVSADSAVDLNGIK
jgi:hypothetical protein